MDRFPGAFRPAPLRDALETSSMFVRNPWFGVFALWLVSHGCLAAQEVQWRPDYQSAFKEAVDKRRPVFMDVVSSGCVHCVTLDAVTFRDPTMVKLLNEYFIPVKVD